MQNALPLCRSIESIPLKNRSMLVGVVESTNRRITFEYALINGQNDTPEEATRLRNLLQGLMCHVNVIPLNPTAGYEGEPSDPVRVQAFIDILEQGGIPATIRVRRGIDIDAGCGNSNQVRMRADEGFFTYSRLKFGHVSVPNFFILRICFESFAILILIV